MSLQSRLASLITAIGTDIKALQASKVELLAMPQLFLNGSHTISGFAAGGIYWLSTQSGGLLAPSNDTNLAANIRRAEIAALDCIAGYKPQMRLRTVLATNTTDPGTQTFSIGVTSVQMEPGGNGGGANNRRYGIGGTLAGAVRTNLAANSSYEDTSAWYDVTTANFAASSMTGDYIGLYTHLSVTPAANALLTLNWTIELRYVPE